MSQMNATAKTWKERVAAFDRNILEKAVQFVGENWASIKADLETLLSADCGGFIEYDLNKKYAFILAGSGASERQQLKFESRIKELLIQKMNETGFVDFEVENLKIIFRFYG